ncbi:uncharacterized protein V1516DRAFT_686002 [Lipomyces oligophaga]|uniref:uncharacterized protein n=1 Tax=Lipomyces oligophaga TaxID=45792 RepID=UPI0034CE21D9
MPECLETPREVCRMFRFAAQLRDPLLTVVPLGILGLFPRAASANVLIPDLIGIGNSSYTISNATSTSSTGNSTTSSSNATSSTNSTNSTSATTYPFINSVDGFSKPNNLLNLCFILLVLVVIAAFFGLRYLHKRRRSTQLRLLNERRTEALRRDLETSNLRRSDLWGNPEMRERGPTNPFMRPAPPPPYEPHHFPRSAYLGGGVPPTYHDAIMEEEEEETENFVEQRHRQQLDRNE